MTDYLDSRIDRDALLMVSRDEVAPVAHALLFGANKERGELLVSATSVLFAVMVERARMDPHDLYSLGLKLLRTHDAHHFKANVQMEALRDFAGMRVRDNPKY